LPRVSDLTGELAENDPDPVSLLVIGERDTRLEEAQAFRHDQANDEQRDHTRRHLLMRAHSRLCLTCCD